MIRQLQHTRNLFRQYVSSNQLRLSPFTSLAVNQSSLINQQVPLKLPNPPAEIEFGGNVKTVVHKSFMDMVPCDEIILPGQIFNAPVRTDLIHRVVHWQLAKRRAGTAKTKSRGEIKASGKKIRPQKGSGQSRQGARSSPIFRGGGRAHGPVPRDYYYPLPKNVRRNALRAVLSSKYQCGQLWIVDSVAIPDSRTKHIIDTMATLGWKSALIIDDDLDGISGVDSSLHVAAHNVRATLPMHVQGLNVYDALSFDMLVMTRPTIEHLEKRYARYDWLF